VLLAVLRDDDNQGAHELVRELRMYFMGPNRAQLTKEGTKRNEAHPWLLAARVLAASTEEEKAKARLTWPQMWDVLRWYAHNRGYDGNIRWSGDFRVEAFSETPLARRKELDDQAESLEGDDPEDDKKKIQAAAARMEDYGFTTPTFAETVAKFLLGPDRTVRSGGEGKPGLVEPTAAAFTETEFRRLLFDCDPGFENRPRHLRNYFKGVRAAFPRRVIKDLGGKATLVGGTEWEVRYIIRAHLGKLPGCEITGGQGISDLERVVCGGLPEAVSDWSALKPRFPRLYLSEQDAEALARFRVPKQLPRREKQKVIGERRRILEGKLALPARYHGGVVFGQLVPRFDNRIIEQCPITFSEIFRGVLDKDERALEPYHVSPAKIAASRRVAGGETESDATLARRWAAKLAKVPAKNCLEFLEFRWGMILANVRVGLQGEIYRDPEGKETSLRPLKAEERLSIDTEARKRGFLKAEPDKTGKDGCVRRGRNELLEIVVSQTGCNRHNLESLLLVPDMREALRILPVEGDARAKEAFQIAWSAFGPPGHDQDTGKYRDDPLRRRFSAQLMRGSKDSLRRLSLSTILSQLQRPDVVNRHAAAPETAAKIEQAARKAASDKRGLLDKEKLAGLMNAPFHCERLTGRARFGRKKLREAVQQIMHKDKPMHPFEKGGCLEQTDAIKGAALQRPLAHLTNSHLVRHRLLILAGDPHARPPKRGLLDDIISAKEFAGGDKGRIVRITIELARDLQTMSGMNNKAKARELSARHEGHDRVSQELTEKLAGVTDDKGRPVEITARLINKARIADDLGWVCPYTRQIIEPADLVRINPRQLATHAAEKDHIIPRTSRLSDALEAQVITLSEVNGMKKARTALEFVKECRGGPVDGLPNLHVRTESQFREFVNSLWPRSDPFVRARAGGKKVSDDEARCWRRKQLLLTEKWEEREFTPADLAKTRHLVKLAAQQLEAAFCGLPKERRPPVICINGAVTAAFRDKTWKLIRELSAVHAGVKQAADGEAEARKRGQDYNLKKEIRGITNLHHALDAVALGLITSCLVPPGHASLNNELVRFIIKTRLSAEERRRFEELRHQLGLPKFYRWSAGRCDDPEARRPAAGAGGIICINDLPRTLKSQIHERLQEVRVVQHVPADQGSLDTDETLYRVFDPLDGHPNSQRLRRWFETLLASGELTTLRKLPDPNDSSETRVLLVSRKRRSSAEDSGRVLHDTGHQWRWRYMLVAKDAVQGLAQNGKLSALKAAKPLGKNFGVIQISRPSQKPEFHIIRPCRAYAQLKEFREANPGAQISLIRPGSLIDLAGPDGTVTRLRIFGSGERPGRGVYFDAAPRDALERAKPEVPIGAFEKGRARLVRCSLVGIPATPVASRPSADSA
jgi:hypothetical protein